MGACYAVYCYAIVSVVVRGTVLVCALLRHRTCVSILVLILVACFLAHFSSEMAATSVKALQREEKVWLCRGTEGRHASGAREEDHT